jgi:hypothetical protein
MALDGEAQLWEDLSIRLTQTVYRAHGSWKYDETKV